MYIQQEFSPVVGAQVVVPYRPPIRLELDQNPIASVWLIIFFRKVWSLLLIPSVCVFLVAPFQLNRWRDWRQLHSTCPWTTVAEQRPGYCQILPGIERSQVSTSFYLFQSLYCAIIVELSGASLSEDGQMIMRCFRKASQMCVARERRKVIFRVIWRYHSHWTDISYGNPQPSGASWRFIYLLPFKDWNGKVSSSESGLVF